MAAPAATPQPSALTVSTASIIPALPPSSSALVLQSDGSEDLAAAAETAPAAAAAAPRRASGPDAWAKQRAPMLDKALRLLPGKPKIYKCDQNEEVQASRMLLIFDNPELEFDFTQGLYERSDKRIKHFYAATVLAEPIGGIWWLLYGRWYNNNVETVAMWFFGIVTMIALVPLAIFVWNIIRYKHHLLGFWIPWCGILVHVGACEFLFASSQLFTIIYTENNTRNVAAILYIFITLLLDLLTRKPFWADVICNAIDVVFFALIMLHNSSYSTLENTAMWSGCANTLANLMFIAIVMPLAVSVVRLYLSYVHDDQLRQRFVSERAVRQEVSEQKMANQEKTAFLAEMSHEIRNPLSVIMGYIQLLQESIEGESENQELLGQVLQTSGLLKRIIDDLLDFTMMEERRVVLSPKPYLMTGLIEETIETMSVLCIHRGLHISSFSNIPESCNHVRVDADRLQQIIYNLMGNSLKYTPKGEIFLFAEGCEVPGGAFFLFRVVDTGRGIRPEDLGKLFNRSRMLAYTQGPVDRMKSHGLGLPLSKHLVDLMNGQIWPDSAGINKGAIFSFTVILPLVTTTASRYNPPTSSTSPTSNLPPSTLNRDGVDAEGAPLRVRTPSTRSGASEHSTFTVSDVPVAAVPPLPRSFGGTLRSRLGGMIPKSVSASTEAVMIDIPLVSPTAISAAAAAGTVPAAAVPMSSPMSSPPNSPHPGRSRTHQDQSGLHSPSSTPPQAQRARDKQKQGHAAPQFHAVTEIGSSTQWPVRILRPDTELVVAVVRQHSALYLQLIEGFPNRRVLHGPSCAVIFGEGWAQPLPRFIERLFGLGKLSEVWAEHSTIQGRRPPTTVAAVAHMAVHTPSDSNSSSNSQQPMIRPVAGPISTSEPPTPDMLRSSFNISGDLPTTTDKTLMDCVPTPARSTLSLHGSPVNCLCLVLTSDALYGLSIAAYLKIIAVECIVEPQQVCPLETIAKFISQTTNPLVMVFVHVSVLTGNKAHMRRSTPTMVLPIQAANVVAEELYRGVQQNPTLRDHVCFVGVSFRRVTKANAMRINFEPSYELHLPLRSDELFSLMETAISHVGQQQGSLAPRWPRQHVQDLSSTSEVDVTEIGGDTASTYAVSLTPTSEPSFDVSSEARRLISNVQQVRRRGDKLTKISPSMLKGVTVLVAEDEIPNQDMAKRMLERGGATVEQAFDGSMALTLYKASRERPYDVILMDVNMPEMNGYEATESIRQYEQVNELSRTYIIALTAHVFESDKQRATHAGMDRVLCKPFQKDELLRAIYEGAQISRENRRRAAVQV